MDILLISLGLILMAVGILGSIVPVIPGTPISWIGLILLYLSPSIEFDWVFIIITGIIAIAIYILDYFVPAIATSGPRKRAALILPRPPRVEEVKRGHGEQ